MLTFMMTVFVASSGAALAPSCFSVWLACIPSYFSVLLGDIIEASNHDPWTNPPRGQNTNIAYP